MPLAGLVGDEKKKRQPVRVRRLGSARASRVKDRTTDRNRDFLTLHGGCFATEGGASPRLGSGNLWQKATARIEKGAGAMAGSLQSGRAALPF